MRTIRKSGEPRALTEWKREMQASPQNRNYDNLPTDIKNAVKEGLLKEQGWICAYTMRLLHSIDDCHLEHIKPQNGTPKEDLDYSNMAACFPRGGGDVSHGYGAPIKGGEKVLLNEDFVSPHHMSCDSRFQYSDLGQIMARNGDLAAERTIALLKLDHRALAELRRIAIEAHGLSLGRRMGRTPRRLKSAAEARRFSQQVLQMSENGRLEPFCAALSQVAVSYAQRVEARSQRMRGQRREAQPQRFRIHP